MLKATIQSRSVHLVRSSYNASFMTNTIIKLLKQRLKQNLDIKRHQLKACPPALTHDEEKIEDMKIKHK